MLEGIQSVSAIQSYISHLLGDRPSSTTILCLAFPEVQTQHSRPVRRLFVLIITLLPNLEVPKGA